MPHMKNSNNNNNSERDDVTFQKESTINEMMDEGVESINKIFNIPIVRKTLSVWDRIESLPESFSDLWLFQKIDEEELISEIKENNFTLDWSHQELGNKTAVLLANILRRNDICSTLLLDWARIGNEGSIALAEVIKNSRTLQHFSFRVNRITGEAMAAFANALENNHTLSSFSAGFHYIGNEGIKLLTKSLKQNNTLSVLNLYEIELSDQEDKYFVDMLSVNHSLLWVGGNRSFEISESIRQYLKRNRKMHIQLCNAIKAGNAVVVEKLIVKGANLIASIELGDNFPLYFFNCHLKNLYNNSPLHLAVIHNQFEITRLLINAMWELNIPLTLKNGKNETALDIAKAKGYTKLVMLLVEKTIEVIIEQQIKQDTADKEELINQQTYRETVKRLGQEIQMQIEANKKIHTELTLQRKDLEKQINTLEKTQQTDTKELQLFKQILGELEAHDVILMKEYETKQEKKKAIQRFSSHPNLLCFYQTVQIKIEELFISAKAAAGGYTQTANGKVGDANDKIELLGQIISLVPMFGSVVTSCVELAVNQTMKYIDGKHQENKVKRISSYATLAELNKIIESTARQLTEWYAPVLQHLSQEPETLQVNQNKLTKFKRAKNLLKRVKNKVKSKVFYEIEKLPAEKFAEFGVAWILEAIGGGTVDSRKVKDPLDVQFLNIVTRQTVRTFTTLTTNNNRSDKIKQRSEKIKSFIQRLSAVRVKTETGVEWVIIDIYTKGGIRTRDGILFGPDTYDYANGTEEAAKARDLIPHNEGLLFTSGQRKTLLATVQQQGEQINLIQQTMAVVVEETWQRQRSSISQGTSRHILLPPPVNTVFAETSTRDKALEDFKNSIHNLPLQTISFEIIVYDKNKLSIKTESNAKDKTSNVIVLQTLREKLLEILTTNVLRGDNEIVDGTLILETATPAQAFQLETFLRDAGLKVPAEVPTFN